MGILTKVSGIWTSLNLAASPPPWSIEDTGAAFVGAPDCGEYC
jgi:hypothetical protein